MTTARHDTEPRALTVGQVADRYGITVRTLHHYDEVGLVRPSTRSAAGYRLYVDADLARLATVVGYRRLGLPLDEIAALLGDGGSASARLRAQRAAVADRIEELQHLAAALDRAIEEEQHMSDTDLRTIFGTAFDDGYAEEAEQRWGDTEAWAETRRRSASYTREDWERAKAESDAVNADLAAAMTSGAPAGSTAAMDAAEAHREHIDRWYYGIDHAFHRNLGDLVASDPHQAAPYESVQPGLAAYLRDAIHANADRHTG